MNSQPCIWCGQLGCATACRAHPTFRNAPPRPVHGDAEARLEMARRLELIWAELLVLRQTALSLGRIGIATSLLSASTRIVEIKGRVER